jgi:hypothetical protein
MKACKICIIRKGLKGTYTPENCDYVFHDEEGLEKHLLEVHNVRTVKQ